MKHMNQKGNPTIEIMASGAVEVNSYLDFGFVGIARNFSFAHVTVYYSVVDNRSLALWACAYKPSPSAKVAATGPNVWAPVYETEKMLLRFWKWYKYKGEENRAVCAVGKTWLGPAQ